MDPHQLKLVFLLPSIEMFLFHISASKHRHSDFKFGPWKALVFTRDDVVKKLPVSVENELDQTWLSSKFHLLALFL